MSDNTKDPAKESRSNPEGQSTPTPTGDSNSMPTDAPENTEPAVPPVAAPVVAPVVAPVIPPVVPPVIPAATGWQRGWPYFGMALLAIFFIALAVFLWNYAVGIGYAKLGTIEGTRPLLVVAAIMSTIAFGGALLIGSLFSNDGTFEERFRHAREIFLVFSGVFGTVIGFYFGAGETKASGLIVSGDVQDSSIVAYATGGTPPYKVTITYGPKAKAQTKFEETKTGWVRFSFDKEKDNIVDSQVSAIDGRSGQSTAQVPSDADKLKAAGWKLP